MASQPKVVLWNLSIKTYHPTKGDGSVVEFAASKV